MNKPKIKSAFTRKKQLERDLKHVNEEIYKRNLELARTNRTLFLLRQIDAFVLESHEDLEKLSQKITDSIKENTEFTSVALLIKPLSHQALRLVGISNSNSSTIPDTVNIEYSTKSWISGEENLLIISSDEINNSKFHTEIGDELITAITDIEGQTIILTKLKARNRLVGLLVVGLQHDKTSVPDNELDFIKRIGEAVGVALDNQILFEENLRVLKQLKRSNEKLKQMDETKDEFISMASHQLRTPLTAVKGYLSMVLEGDTGKVAPNQRELLDQAYISAQRMVYLIADLLNVSRLRTGKFVIDLTDCNLADIVAGEVNQLQETAKSRNLELNYKKPDGFPTLQLDETKIRQVVMNFVDNAIYYTPSGGHINVILEDKPESIEFRVEDDGLGVPKADQHQLFTKFYRAGNAKKARPDGTGLGLFMAKKVVVAQGGAIIFRSQEGKGSTFGFTFKKKAK